VITEKRGSTSGDRSRSPDVEADAKADIEAIELGIGLGSGIGIGSSASGSAATSVARRRNSVTRLRSTPGSLTTVSTRTTLRSRRSPRQMCSRQPVGVLAAQ